jgi:MFS family permease
MTYAPLGTFLSELFPVEIRYTGSSLAFNLAGILGASLAPYAATSLAISHGLRSVGLYLAIMAAVSLLALLFTVRKPNDSLKNAGSSLFGLT